MIIEKKQKKTIEWERLGISSRKLEIPREYFMHLDFLELRQVLSSYVGDLRDRSGGLRKGQSPCELLGGLLGFLSR